MHNKNFCPKCGHPAQHAHAFCTECGAQLAPAAPQEEPLAHTSPVLPPPAPLPAAPTRNRVTAGFLALFLGMFGVHKFYTKRYLEGVLYLIFFWTGIPYILGTLEGVSYLFFSNSQFERYVMQLFKQKNNPQAAQ